MVLRRILVGMLVAPACVAALPGLAAAQPPPPPPPPPPPNVNAWAPANPQDYAVLDGTAYAFTAGPLTCMLQRSGGYGCQGPLPGAPEGANVISGAAGGVPGFGSTPRPIFEGEVAALPPNTRLLAAFFSAVMPRTAGFNAIDIGAMTPEGLFFTDFLMFIGGGTAGTAGGSR